MLSVAGLMALSACDEHPYEAPRHSAPPPAAPPAELMGAPDQGSPYTAPPVYQQPTYQQPAYAPPPVYQQPAYAPSPYDNDSVVAMAPIPNPGDPGSGPYYQDEGRYYRHGRVHARYEAAGPAQTAENTSTSPYGEGHPAPGRHPHYTYPATAPTTTPPVYAKATPPVYTPPKTAADTHKVKHTGGAAVAAGAAAVGGVLASDARHLAAQVKQATAKAVPDKTYPPTPTSTATPSGDRATNLASLQTTLTDAVGKTAILTTPASFIANQPTDVSLTLPAGFGDTVKSAAGKDGLGDAAASVAMTALLSGDGFAVTPSDTQSAQLVLGQPTEFHWTVTAQSGAKGPLHADVGADLLGGGSDQLALGSVQKTAGMGIRLTPRVVGALLLVLIAILVVAWLALLRGPARTGATRRTSRVVTRDGRPLDMSTTTVDETTIP